MGLFDDVLDNVGKPHGGKGFEYGTHEVLIDVAEAKAKDTQKVKGAAVIEVTVVSEEDNDKSATCTLWFHTDGAAKMSVTKVLGLLVHKVDEDKKDAVRELGKKLFGTIDDYVKARDIAAKLINDKLLGAKGFLVAEPQGKYSTTSYGDLWHYPAVPQGNPSPVAVVGTDGTDEIKTEDLPDFGEL